MPQTAPERALLDAVSSPLHPAARETLMAAIDLGWADPSRLHREGRRARQLLDDARSVIAEGLGLAREEVTFHASSSHALQTGLRGLRTARRRIGQGTVAAAIDQAIVLREIGSEAGSAAVAVEHDGRIIAPAWAEAVRADGVAVATTAHGNGEVGTQQSVASLHADTEQAGVPFLLDVSSSWGRVPLPPTAEAYAGSAASFAGPPLGVLGVRTGTRLAVSGPPSSPEAGRDLAGPWVPLALAAAEAWRQGADDAQADAREARALIDLMRATAAGLPDVQVAGHAVDRLPHIVTFSVLYVDGEALVHELDRRGLAVASGSACTADTLAPSHVLAAMGVVTHGNVRITLPRRSVAPRRQEWVERLCRELPDAISAVRAHLGTSQL